MREVTYLHWGRENTGGGARTHAHRHARTHAHRHAHAGTGTHAHAHTHRFNTDTHTQTHTDTTHTHTPKERGGDQIKISTGVEQEYCLLSVRSFQLEAFGSPSLLSDLLFRVVWPLARS